MLFTVLALRLRSGNTFSSVCLSVAFVFSYPGIGEYGCVGGVHFGPLNGNCTEENVHIEQILFSCEFLDIVFETRPTRITQSTATLIDNIIVSRDLYAKGTCGIVLSDLSDHLPCIASFRNLKSVKGETLTITTRNMKGSNLTALKSDLAKLDWLTSLLNMNASDQFNVFHGKLIKLLDEHCPEKTCTIPNKRVIKEPWLTKGLLNCINKQQALYKKFLQAKTELSEHAP